MSLGEVKRVNMPFFDELAVLHFWPDMKNDEAFMRYFPTRLPKGRFPDRDYFWNIMHTLMPEYTQALIKHANE